RVGRALSPFAGSHASGALGAARPPPLRYLTLPVFPSWMSQKASPPRLVMCGYTTARTALAAIAASTAEPPPRNTSTPAADASECGDVTMPEGARVTGRPVGIFNRASRVVLQT